MVIFARDVECVALQMQELVTILQSAVRIEQQLSWVQQHGFVIRLDMNEFRYRYEE